MFWHILLYHFCISVYYCMPRRSPDPPDFSLFWKNCDLFMFSKNFKRLERNSYRPDMYFGAFESYLEVIWVSRVVFGAGTPKIAADTPRYLQIPSLSESCTWTLTCLQGIPYTEIHLQPFENKTTRNFQRGCRLFDLWYWISSFVISHVAVFMSDVTFIISQFSCVVAHFTCIMSKLSCHICHFSFHVPHCTCITLHVFVYASFVIVQLSFRMTYFIWNVSGLISHSNFVMYQCTFRVCHFTLDTSHFSLHVAYHNSHV